MDTMTEEELLNQIYTAISRGEALASVMRIAAEGARSLFSGHAATIYFFDAYRKALPARLRSYSALRFVDSASP